MAFADGTADFRSDTVTRPTPEMRRAMADAEVGDDVYGDDPTVNRLQEEAAAVVGKEAAIFVPTGTMGNQLSLMVQTRPGDDVLCDEGAHVRNIEKGAASAFSGVSFRPVHAPEGWIQPNQIDAVMATAGAFFPRIRLMVWENSHNLSGGRVTPVEGMAAGNAAARKHGLSIHLDGARIFNGAAALGVGADELADGVDTVTFCFSKGLGAPVGSIICACRELIDEIHYLRKRMGGGMRQVGVLAAPARIALRDRDRVADDNDLAKYLATQIADHAPDALDPRSVETNIVNVAVDRLPVPIDVAIASIRSNGMSVNPPLFGGVWRLVTHRDVDRGDVDRLVTTLFHAGQ
ncbi:MAG: GntG family PLP-dependent aldolase [Acidimicrobiia bacterium]